MEERAPGGELRFTPQRWLELLSFGVRATPEERERCALLPDVPLTRMQWIEAMAFAKQEAENGDL